MRLIRNAANLGYTGGNNVAMRAAVADGFDRVFLLNSDARLPPGTLARLMAAMDADPGLGILSPVIVHEGTGEVEFAGATVDVARAAYETVVDPAAGRALLAARPGQFVVNGTAMLIASAVLERIGCFDDGLFAYWEDTDLCLRAQLAGYRAAVAFDSVALHRSRPAAQAREARPPHYYYFMTRNEVVFWRRHCTALVGLKAGYWATRRALGWVARHGDDAAIVDACANGLWHGWCGRGGAWQPRGRLPVPLRRLLVGVARRLVPGGSRAAA